MLHAPRASFWTMFFHTQRKCMKSFTAHTGLLLLLLWKGNIYLNMEKVVQAYHYYLGDHKRKAAKAYQSLQLNIIVTAWTRSKGQYLSFHHHPRKSANLSQNYQILLYYLSLSKRSHFIILSQQEEKVNLRWT